MDASTADSENSRREHQQDDDDGEKIGDRCVVSIHDTYPCVSKAMIDLKKGQKKRREMRWLAYSLSPEKGAFCEHLISNIVQARFINPYRLCDQCRSI